MLTLPLYDMACWAIRRGHPHLVEEKHPGLLCGHIAGADNGHYLCVPLMVNGQAIGILHLNRLPEDRPEAAARRDESYGEHFLQITVTIAEHIALALSNLRLRESLREQSIRDALTGLFNRRYLEETLERELMRAQREKRPVAMDATASTVRVLIESSDGDKSWTTVGVSTDIIAASWQALTDSIEYILHKKEAAARCQ